MVSISQALVTLKESTSPEVYATALKTMHKFAKNVCDTPSEEKFRRVRLENEAFKKKVGNHPGGLDAMRAIGFVEVEGADNAGFLVLTPTEAAWTVLQAAKQTLETHIQQAEAANAASAPPPPAAAADPMGMAQQMLNNRQDLAAAMANPAMMSNPTLAGALQAAMQNPQVLQAAMENPQVQQMMSGNPMMQQMFGDPAAMQRMLSDPMAQELLSNPAALQQAVSAFQQGGGMAGMGGLGGMGGGMGGGGLGGLGGIENGLAGASLNEAGAAPPARGPPAAAAPGGAPQMSEEEMLEMAIQESLQEASQHQEPK